MLNLLIAIISETFANIVAEQVTNSYKEKARQVSLIQDTLLGMYKTPSNPNDLIFIAKPISSADIVAAEEADTLEVVSENVDHIIANVSEIMANKQ